MELSNSVNYLCSTYGDAFADVYDDWYQQVTDVEGTAALISNLSEGLDVLELGVGTGRLALPIAAAGVPITGVDSSSEMLKRLTARDTSGLVTTHLADMASWLPTGPFKVIFCAYNTFFNLVNPDDQEKCLQLVSDRLTPDGLFVLEAFVPSNYPLLPTRAVESRHMTKATVLNITIREKISGVVRGQSVQVGEAGPILRPWRILIKTPDELDQVAARHGLDLVERWQDWHRSPFTSSSDHHVSVYASGSS
ncbi:MAG: class I SAM-dependent methyltransferase [Acidimicrobiales bacterium]|jgi:SAM-dependent methyltransferase|nr:class I SAM-dependent methyltransferase [Acidimicrobiales bacterium]HJL99275.1 class I SAM-dependent methyltransferase [Acidimicrobiales bacterium]